MKKSIGLCYLLLAISLLSIQLIIFVAFFPTSDAGRSFAINYTENAFYMDGKPFQFVSGSAHYFRMPNQYWKDRLRKIKAAGLNAISTYVEWSQHEPVQGQYNFDGDLDVKKFIETAQEEGLFVILRPGPYICAERDMGGLPYWLMAKHPDVELRTSDTKYTRHVEKWLDILMERLSPLLYGRGGPIILVQVENEYGSYDRCDFAHTIWLRDLFRQHVKKDAVLFTTDGASRSLLRCGKIPEVYATVDFGPEHNVTKMFNAQREFEPRGPLVNSEYYPGWLTHWGEEKLARQKTKDVVETLKKMLDRKANVNFYMFYGGSNFGFTAGANLDRFYQSDITSYDYDAPISEAGDLTEKYYAIKEVLHQYFGPQFNKSVDTSEKGDYGQITLRRVATIFSPKIREKLGKLQRNLQPLSFEALDQNVGYVLYETEISFNSLNVENPNVLEIEKVRDLAHVYVDGQYAGNMSREEGTTKLNLQVQGARLSLMVENLGRINFGPYINDKKGILSHVILGGEKLTAWNMTGFELKELKAVEDCFHEREIDCDNNQGFVFYIQKFTLPEDTSEREEVLDSFLDVSQMTKGLVFINGFNLGRYWSWRGPQYTIYVPGVHLKPYPQENTIILLEENINSESIKLNFTKIPIFN